MTLFLTWFVSAIKYGTVILYGAMGEIVTEKAGHLNLGTPGIMVFGGAFGFISGFTYFCFLAAGLMVFSKGLIVGYSSTYLAFAAQRFSDMRDYLLLFVLFNIFKR